MATPSLKLFAARMRAIGRRGHWFWVLLLSCVSAAAAQNVTVLLSDSGGIYQQAATALQAELQTTGVTVAQQTLAARRAPHDEDWVVALGVAALQRVLEERAATPVLAALVPRARYEQLTAGTTRRVTALYLDQPVDRIAALQRLALPDSRRSGVLLGPSTQSLRAELEQAAARQKLSLRVRAAASPREVFPELVELVEAVDVLWLLPDPLVVNRQTLQSLLLQTFRQRCPVLAYSPGLVEAGALLGLYATPAQLGREAGQWLNRLLRTDMNALPAPRFPQAFSVKVNASVARALDLKLPGEIELARRLRALEPL